VAENSPNRLILCAGAGGYAATNIYETPGIYLEPEKQTAENVLASLDRITDTSGQEEYTDGGSQTFKFLKAAADHHGVKLG